MTKFRVHQFAERIGKSVSTVRRWDREGRLKAKRTTSGERYYEESDIRQALRIDAPSGKVVVYCRVSSGGQKDDLASQVKAMEQFCLGAGIPVNEWVSEVGGGMNFKRKKFLSLMSQIGLGEISKLIVAHKDRLARFGFDYFEHYALEHGCQIIDANQQSLSPQQELVEDLLAIVHCFSSRLYGLRKHKKVIKAELVNESHSDRQS